MLRYWWIAVLVFAADRVSKVLALRLTEPVILIPGILSLELGTNTGAAFSILSGNPLLLGLISLAILTGGVLLLRSVRLGPLSRTGFMLVLGGGLGNMVDRLFQGSVVDMIRVLFIDYPIFNVADMAIVVGMILLMLSLLIKPEEWKSCHGND